MRIIIHSLLASYFQSVPIFAEFFAAVTILETCFERLVLVPRLESSLLPGSCAPGNPGAFWSRTVMVIIVVIVMVIIIVIVMVIIIVIIQSSLLYFTVDVPKLKESLRRRLTLV